MTDEARAIRAAKNEDLFREVNERVEDVSAGSGSNEFEALCECADATCRAAVPVSRAAYEDVRAEANHFLVLPGHTLPDVERVVVEADRYWVVEKLGRAAEEAERLDPRSV